MGFYQIKTNILFKSFDVVLLQKVYKRIFLKKLLAVFILFFMTANINANTKTIHVLVALCDDTYQGIVPTSFFLGNDQNPKTNLYWDAMYRFKSYFDRQKYRELIKTEKVDEFILERAIYKYKIKDIYIVADAYNGKNMKNILRDYFDYLAGLHVIPTTGNMATEGYVVCEVTDGFVKIIFQIKR